MNLSIRARLHLGASVVMLAFFCLAGWAVQGVYSDHLRNSHFERLQSSVYTLIAMTELGAQGQLELPAQLAEPLLSVPQSGLYAQIDNPSSKERWTSPSAVNLPSFPNQALNTGAWQLEEIIFDHHRYLSSAYQVRWKIGEDTQILRFRILEDTRRYAAQLQQFQRALWGWLAAAAACLLLAQVFILRWGLQPLRQLEGELGAIEQGEQTQVNGEYPREIAPLALRLNRLVEQEHARQKRYREALADLAHSLKTPLAILRADHGSDDLSQRVTEQVERMDHIVQHQLGRAALRGSAELASALALKPIAERLVAAMEKVHGNRGLTFTLSCPADLTWPLDEGDAFEVLGNVLDNAGKWATSRVDIQLASSSASLTITIADDGPGFADTTAALQRGVRLDERVAGHGIGLSVVADIVQAYQGQLQLTRSTLGGASVIITIPKTIAPSI